jgi:hypothetical protein
MANEEFVPAQKLVKEDAFTLSVEQAGLKRTFNFLSDKLTVGETTRNFRELDAAGQAEAEVMREKLKAMGGTPRLSPQQAMQAGGWH